MYVFGHDVFTITLVILELCLAQSRHISSSFLQALYVEPDTHHCYLYLDRSVDYVLLRIYQIVLILYLSPMMITT